MQAMLCARPQVCGSAPCDVHGRGHTPASVRTAVATAAHCLEVALINPFCVIRLSKLLLCLTPVPPSCATTCVVHGAWEEEGRVSPAMCASDPSRVLPKNQAE